MTAYKYTPAPEPSMELQKRIKAAKQRAANLAAQVEISRLEAVNAEAEATLHAAREHNERLQAEIKRRRDESKKWPVHPDWMLHRKQLEHEVKMFQQGRVNRRMTAGV